MAMRYGVLGGEAGLVAGEAYFDAVRSQIESATERCLASVFIVDPRPAHDPQRKVLAVLHAMQEAAWRAVDTRLLVGASRTNLDIAETATATLRTAERLGVETRWLTARDVRGSHTKLVIADDTVLVGSHNWSGGAMGGQVQHSVLVRSAGLAARLAVLFERQWERAKP